MADDAGNSEQRRPYLGGVLAAAAGLSEPAEPYHVGVRRYLSVLPRVANLAEQPLDATFREFLGFYKKALEDDGLPAGVVAELMADAERVWADMEGERT